MTTRTRMCANVRSFINLKTHQEVLHFWCRKNSLRCSSSELSPDWNQDPPRKQQHTGIKQMSEMTRFWKQSIRSMFRTPVPLWEKMRPAWPHTWQQLGAPRASANALVTDASTWDSFPDKFSHALSAIDVDTDMSSLFLAGCQSVLQCGRSRGPRRFSDDTGPHPEHCMKVSGKCQVDGCWSW